MRGSLPELKHVWQIDDGAVDELVALGASVSDDDVERRRTALTPDDLATIIYTSGTTGRPKGCMLTHGNFMFELGVAVAELHQLFDDEDSATLLFLPLAHVFARLIQIGAVKARCRLGHSADMKNLVADLGSFQPTFVLAVPRVFEKVYNTASQKAAADGKGRIFDQAAETAIAYSKALDGRRVGLLLRAQHALFDRLVYGKLRAALGGRCAYAISGGAPLGERLGHFFRGIGVIILEGYGLTETTAALTANLPETSKIGTVGRPLPGTAVRIADDGELLVKGDQVFTGYWHNPEATAEALSADGWFHTGDLGELDDDGFVRITGRKKEIIVTAGGKNVAPAVLEDRLRAHPLVSQCMVVGDGQPVHRRAGHHRPGGVPAVGRAARQDRCDRGPQRGPRPARRGPARGRRGQQGGLPGRVDPEVHDPPGRLDRGGRPAHAQPQAQAQRGDPGVPRRCRGALLPLIGWTRSSHP